MIIEYVIIARKDESSLDDNSSGKEKAPAEKLVSKAVANNPTATGKKEESALDNESSDEE